MFGAKGVGKSTVVDAVIHGRPGILKVQISAGCKEDLLRQVTDALLILFILQELRIM